MLVFRIESLRTIQASQHVKLNPSGFSAHAIVPKYNPHKLKFLRRLCKHASVKVALGILRNGLLLGKIEISIFLNFPQGMCDNSTIIDRKSLYDTNILILVGKFLKKSILNFSFCIFRFTHFVCYHGREVVVNIFPC